MARKYDSSRRRQAAERTREAILAAAVRLHGLGIMDLETLAKEADVSIATVRKHFATRELLYENCIAYGMRQFTLPDMKLIASTTDAVDRTRLAVREFYGFNELVFGHAWESFKGEGESAAVAALVAKIEGMTREIAQLIVDAWPVDEDRIREVRGFVIALLHPLTYRALRRYGGLTPDQAIQQAAAALLRCLEEPAPLSGEEVAHR